MRKIYTYKGFKFEITVMLNNRLNNDRTKWIHDLTCTSIEIPELYEKQRLKYSYGAGAFDEELINYIKNCEEKAQKWVEENILPDQNNNWVSELTKMGFENGE